MLIFKIICILILIVFILFGFAFIHQINTDMKNDDIDDVKTANGILKATWILLIGFGCVLVYIIMN